MHLPRKPLRPENYGMKDGLMATQAMVELWNAQNSNDRSRAAQQRIEDAQARIRRVIEKDMRGQSY